MRATLRQLAVFAAVARQENVSRAADSLAMSQSAASNALLELERNYDCLLFDRIGKSLHLNAVGRGLLPLVEDLLARAATVDNYLAGRTLVPLAIGATLTVGNYLATLLVADYLRRYPGARITLNVSNTAHIVERLQHFELDLGMVEGEASAADLVFTPWLEDELVVFCAQGHPLAAQGILRSTDFPGQKWIVREAGSGTRAQFDQAMRRCAADPAILLELEHTEAIKRAVESGIGIGCLSRLSLREAFRRGSLVEIATPDLRLTRTFYFVRHRERTLSAAGERFLECCRDLSGNAMTTDQLTLPFIP